MATETETIIPLSKEFNYSFEIIQKSIDEEKRIIEGFATTEDVDREDQVVSLKAVEKALILYQKNPTVRADHKAPPIGTTLSAKAMQKDGHKGLFVRVQIGKNTRACDEAWALIKQGLYKAFSIGGIVKAIKSVYSKVAGKHIQKISEIMISEISITDAPANQACMFTVLGKSLSDIDTSSLEVDTTMTDTEFSKQVEDFSKRMDVVEKGQESMGVEQKSMGEDITVIKTLLEKQAGDSETEEEKKKKKEKEEEAEKQTLIQLKKGLVSLGFSFPKDPLRTASNEGDEGNDPIKPSSGPLTIEKMFKAKYGAPPEQTGGIA